ncbi:hypothetical protein A8950_1081 [Dongia mobilis]|uniref:Uncharacterized protein n=1 Tax=Dongia mobilis TaxID=578943 RepID=A0A4R6WWU7_9PROT|nr:hypothetical protein [Dongia mobilis]TDQ84524.1 hypothetical protein A8950_1081 [Dongia mobilis]
MPEPVRFMLKHALFGYAAALVFVTLFLVLDLGGLASLMRSSEFGLLAMALLFFFTGLTFASLQMGIAVMSLRPRREGEDSGGDAGGANALASALPVRIHSRHRR